MPDVNSLKQLTHAVCALKKKIISDVSNNQSRHWNRRYNWLWKL